MTKRVFSISCNIVYIYFHRPAKKLLFWTTCIIAFIIAYASIFKPPYSFFLIVKYEDPKYKHVTVSPEPPSRITVEFNEELCPMRYNVAPQPNVQMLSMYEQMTSNDTPPLDGSKVEYNPEQWNSANKLKVFIVPHSHNDPGWLMTFEEYYQTQTNSIFTNMVEKLNEKHAMKFIWAETSFLALWWSTNATKEQKVAFKRHLNNKTLEIVTGGWVMNDEANPHWLSILQQLTTGHQWLIDNLDYIPKNTWAIDPFGHSSSQPYLLKLAGFENSVIQRVHYRVKKELGLNRQLEFRWRQLWDVAGVTDMFTHMMPMDTYIIPGSCGPDPKVCCQYNYRTNMVCSWGTKTQMIVDNNQHERSYLILDQWRKKAQFYRSNVVFMPLGGDFTYDFGGEWDNQYSNYKKIIDYINNKEEWYTEVQFGTLEDYFKALHEEIKLEDFPVLTGDFFTYAHKSNHYWSGYYTSRPFYKNMDRVLLAYVRAAEIATAQVEARQAASISVVDQLQERVEDARRALSLFQHHDAITGTCKDHVIKDYGKKMLTAMKNSQSAIQQSAFYLLGRPKVAEQTEDVVYLQVGDIWTRHDEIPSKYTITLDATSSSQKVVLYNALAFNRTELLTVLVSSPHVKVYDSKGSLVMAQVSPVIAGKKELYILNNKFQLSFLATVGPLALATYIVSLKNQFVVNNYTTYAKVRIYNSNFGTVDLPNTFPVEKPKDRLDNDLALSIGEMSIVCNKNGMLKSMTVGGKRYTVNMDYVYYSSSKSGAYLFMPSSPTQILKINPYPTIVTTEGPIKTTIYSAIASKRVHIIFSISIKNNPTLPQSEVEICNTFIIDPVGNFEFALRFSTSIDNRDVFYTDLNGMQMIKRRYFEKFPLQANYYPLPMAAYIEDDLTRFTVLTSTPLGVTALAPGQIEIMQDRRLLYDDGLGLDQGVVDNVRTRHTFRLLLENANSCKDNGAESRLYGALSLGAHVSSQTLLQPLVVLHAVLTPLLPPPFAPRLTNAADLILASFRSHVSTKNKDGKTVGGIGMTFQRVHLDNCYENSEIAKWYPIGDGQVQISEFIDVLPEQVFESTLTHNRILNPLPNGVLTLCPMEIRSIFINHTYRVHATKQVP